MCGSAAGHEPGPVAGDVLPLVTVATEVGEWPVLGAVEGAPEERAARRVGLHVDVDLHGVPDLRGHRQFAVAEVSGHAEGMTAPQVRARDPPAQRSTQELHPGHPGGRQGGVLPVDPGKRRQFRRPVGEGGEIRQGVDAEFAPLPAPVAGEHEAEVAAVDELAPAVVVELAAEALADAHRVGRDRCLEGTFQAVEDAVGGDDDAPGVTADPGGPSGAATDEPDVPGRQTEPVEQDMGDGDLLGVDGVAAVLQWGDDRCGQTESCDVHHADTVLLRRAFRPTRGGVRGDGHRHVHSGPADPRTVVEPDQQVDVTGQGIVREAGPGDDADAGGEGLQGLLLGGAVVDDVDAAERHPVTLTGDGGQGRGHGGTAQGRALPVGLTVRPGGQGEFRGDASSGRGAQQNTAAAATGEVCWSHRCDRQKVVRHNRSHPIG
jgi:hypothetical protein